MTGISGQKVDLLGLVPHSNPAWLRNYDFEGCDILGPVVLLLAGERVSFIGCTMASSAFWPIDDGERFFDGGVGLDGVTFTNCTFQGVGIAGPRELIDSFFGA